MNLCTTYRQLHEKPKEVETLPNIGEQAEWEDLRSNNNSPVRCQILL